MARDRTQDFVELLARNQRRLYAYIRPQVASPTDADDVLQQTSKVLWTKFDQFESGTNFLTWACTVARLEVLTYHRERKRQPAFLSDQVAEVLADDLVAMVETIDDRHEALAACLQELPAKERDLVQRRYEADANIRRIAADTGRSESAVYKALQRVHDGLYRCIERKLSSRDAGR